MLPPSLLSLLRIRRRGRRARTVAVAISLLVHVAAGWLLLRPRPAPPPSPAAIPLELEIITQAAPAEGSVRAEDLATPAAPAPAPATPSRRRPGRRIPAPPPSGSPPPSSEPAAPSPSEGTATLGMRFTPPRGDLTPSFDTLDRLTRDGVIAPADPTGLAGRKPRGPTFSERLAARVRDDGARANVAAGKVHPLVYDLLRDAQRGFTPAPEILDDDPRTPNTVGRTLRQWGRWLGEDGHRQLADERRRLQEHHAARRGERGPRAPDRTDEDVLVAAQPIACLVCLVLRPPAAPEVVLGASSGNAALDRQAMTAVRRAANTRPVDGDVRAQRSCYRFQATVFRVPPLPTFGCLPDGKGGVSCLYPLKKVIKTSVVLESVDYDG